MQQHGFVEDTRGLGNSSCTQTGWIPPSGAAGTWSTSSNGQTYKEATICPNRPGEMVEPWYQFVGSSIASAGVIGNSSKVMGDAYIGNETLRPISNLFVGVEHLQNADGTIVPIIWDFYIDTSITVEVLADEWPFRADAFYINNGEPTYSTGYAIHDKGFAHWNQRGNTHYGWFEGQFIDHDSGQAPTGPGKWGPLFYMYHGFGSLGLLGSMYPSQNLNAIYPDLSQCTSAADGTTLCVLPNKKRPVDESDMEDTQSGSSRTSTSTASKFGRKVFGSKR